MPNWCENDLTITFPNKETKAAFKEKYFVDGDFDFDKIIPEPRYKDECEPDCLINKDSHVEISIDRPWFNWYIWHNRHWGTKWNACDTSISDESDTKMLLSFNTAWCPPTPVIDKLIKDNPSLKIEHDYYCEG